MVIAVVFGSTGAVGKQLVIQASNNSAFEKVRVVLRRKIDYPDADKDKIEFHEIADFNEIEKHKDLFKGDTICLYALGSTKAKAGSAEAFRKIDFDLALKIAQTAKDCNARHFGLVSSVGANKNSLFLYPRVKGEIEEAIKNLNFPSCKIYRPGYLEIDEGRDERRLGEKTLGLFMPVLKCLSDSAAINVKDLSHFMINKALEDKEEFALFENSQMIKELREEKRK